MLEQDKTTAVQEQLPSRFSELPELEFSQEERQSAIERINKIQQQPIRAKERVEIVGLVIKNGLFELYPQLAELSDTKKMNQILNSLAAKKSAVIDSFEKEQWKEIYWNNVEYPAIANLILRDKVAEIDMEKLIKQSADMRVTPSKRFTFLYDLVFFYKNASEEEKKRIKRVLRDSIKDYHEKIEIGQNNISQNFF